ncbi:MAG: radical SAM protein [Nitrososphaeria archaeon]
MFLLKTKGIKYTYNFVHFYTFYGTKNPLLVRYLYWFKPYPSYLEIEVTTKCNLRCVMCEHTYWDEPVKDMTFEEFKYIIDQFPKLKWIGLTGIGESFLNKDFMKMLEYVKSRNIFVELYDTFYFIDDYIAKDLIRMGVDKIFASIDAATKETYERIRVGSNFERVINNAKNLIRQKKEAGAYFPRIAFHYIINKENLHEIPHYIQLVSSLAEGDKVNIQFTRMLHKYQEVRHLFTEIPEEIIHLAEKEAKKHCIDVTWNADVPQCKPPINKCTEWVMPFIFVTGHVIPCCSGNEAGHRDFQKETAMGNVFEKSFKEIWNGKKYSALRQTLKQNKVPLPCCNCCLYEIEVGKRDGESCS